MTDDRRPGAERIEREPPAAREAPGPRPDSTRGHVASRVAAAISDAVDRVEGAAGAVVGATSRRLDERPGARVRRVRRMGGEPLRFLFDVHPDGRSRTPRELGVRTIDVADVAGTAVGGAQQRGGDFLPLKPFRSRNWQARWQRLNRASAALAILPPIDVVKYDDRYWVVDGHNRVAQALYGGQASIDADVTELVESGRSGSEPPESFASLVHDSRQLRAAASRTATKPNPTGER